MRERGLVAYKDRVARLMGSPLRPTTRMRHPRSWWKEHIWCDYAIQSPKRCPKWPPMSYSYDIYSRPIKEIVSHGLLLFALLIRHVSRMYHHLNICTGSIPF